MERGFEKPEKESWKSIPQGGTLVNTRTGQEIKGQPKPEKPEITETEARKQIMAIEKSIVQMEKSGKADPMMMMLAKSMGVNLPDTGEQLPPEAKKRFMDAAGEQLSYYKQFVTQKGGTGGAQKEIISNPFTGENKQQPNAAPSQTQKPSDEELIKTFQADPNIQQRIASGKPFYIKTQWGNLKFDGKNLTWE